MKNCNCRAGGILTVVAFAGLIAVVMRGPSTDEDRPPAGRDNENTEISIGVDDPDAEKMLVRASAVCLAEIASLEELDERSSDGDHWIKASLKVLQSSGDIPEFLILIRNHGGLRPPEAVDELVLPSKLRYDSLRAGERHWFAFGSDWNRAEYPWRVTGWWPDGADNLPRVVVEAARADRFARRPEFDKQSGLIVDWKEDADDPSVTIRVVEESEVIWQRTVAGRADRRLNVLQVFHPPYPFSNEMRWPDGKAEHSLVLKTIGPLNKGDDLALPPGDYRQQHGFDLRTGRPLGIVIAEHNASWIPRGFVQLDLDTGRRTVIAEIGHRKTGGLDVGAETDVWLSKTERRYDPESGALLSTEAFRYGSIKNADGVHERNGWILIQPPPDSRSVE